MGMRSLTLLLTTMVVLTTSTVTAPVEAQPIALVYIKVVDTMGRPLSKILISISPETGIERTMLTDEEGLARVFIFKDEPWSWGSYKIKVQDAVLNPLETDTSEVTFSKPGEMTVITVKDARLITVDVKEDEGTPPIAAILVVIEGDVFAHPLTYTTNGRIEAFPVKKNYTGSIYVGSPLRRTAAFTPPAGEDFEAEVTLKTSASLNLSLVDEEAVLKLTWDGVETYDVGRYMSRVPYVITVNFTLPDGRSSNHASPNIYLTRSPGEYTGRFKVDKEWENSTVTVNVMINISFFRPGREEQDALRAYGDPWLERLANIEDPLYHRPILKAAYSLEAIRLRSKYTSTLGRIESLQGQVASLDKNLTELKARYEYLSRNYTSLKDRLTNAEVNTTSLANQLTQAKASITSLQEKLAEAYDDLTSIKGELKETRDRLNTKNTTILLASVVPTAAAVILALLYVRKSRGR